MKDHIKVLAQAIRFEIEMMGDFGKLPNTKICNHYPFAKSLEWALDYLTRWKNPSMNDVLHYITKLWNTLNDYHENGPKIPKEWDAKRWETVLRLIDLERRIEREWFLIRGYKNTDDYYYSAGFKKF